MTEAERDFLRDVRKRLTDLTRDVTVALAERDVLAERAVKVLESEKRIATGEAWGPCPQCGGTGSETRSDDSYSRITVQCGRCLGKGRCRLDAR